MFRARPVALTTAIVGKGLEGDRTANTTSSNPMGSNRQVTLIQAEHLKVISALLGREVQPAYCAGIWWCLGSI